MRDHAQEAPALARRGARITRPDEAIAVRAWITQGQSGESQVDAHAIAWTTTQVHVRYVDARGREGWAWLWALAVERR